MIIYLFAKLFKVLLVIWGNYYIFFYFNLSYFCDVVDDGNAAISKLKSEHYDVLLIDNYMSGMDGVSAVIEIRKFNSSIPIIGITGESSESVILNFKSAGINMILFKPVKSSELVKSLKSLISNKKVL